MAGLYDRIAPGTDRVSVHYLTSAVFLDGMNVFTTQQIVNSINSKLVVPLDSAAVADLTAIVALATGQQPIGNLEYLHRFESLNVACEAGFITETVWRNHLGL